MAQKGVTSDEKKGGSRVSIGVNARAFLNVYVHDDHLRENGCWSEIYYRVSSNAKIEFLFSVPSTTRRSPFKIHILID
jgi:hypothetical protein